MMGPVTCCLLLVMFAMEARDRLSPQWDGYASMPVCCRDVLGNITTCPEVDVTLTKIEEIDSHFIAWSSSVLAARPAGAFCRLSGKNMTETTPAP